MHWTYYVILQAKFVHTFEKREPSWIDTSSRISKRSRMKPNGLSCTSQTNIFIFIDALDKIQSSSKRSSEKWKERVGKFFIWTRRILTTFNFVDSVLPKRVLDSPDSLTSIIAKIISRLFGIKVGIAYFIFLFYLDHFESDDWSSY